MNQKQLVATITNEFSGLRLDQALAKLFPEYSRSRLQAWIKSGQVSVDGKPLKAKDKVFTGQAVIVNAIVENKAHWQAQKAKLDIIYEDETIIIINKPPGLVVHPGAGNTDHTLVNALLHHAPELNQLPRAGTIHRIDKDTSGLLVFARSLPAYTALVQQMQARQIHREYLAIAIGVIIAGGSINRPIGRHPSQRTRMAIVDNGKTAITHYRIAERFRAHTLLKIILETGRTHQIRVHMAHLGYPLLGDQTYGGRLKIPSEANENLKTALTTFKRQALHAQQLSLVHPITKKNMTWEAPIPNDMQQLIELLRIDQKAHASLPSPALGRGEEKN